jgi:1,4-dihydroxy-2-naphthoate octaprenyltransferase
VNVLCLAYFTLGHNWYIVLLALVYTIKFIRKVRQTQNHNPEFGHTQGEIKKKHAKKYTSIQRG